MSKKFKKAEYIPPFVNPKKVQTEEQSRINVLNIAEKLKLKTEAEEIFRKYDAILAKYQDPEERKQIATMGAVEIYKLLGFQSGIDVAGQTIIPPTEKFIKESEGYVPDDKSKIVIPK